MGSPDAYRKSLPLVSWPQPFAELGDFREGRISAYFSGSEYCRGIVIRCFLNVNTIHWLQTSRNAVDVCGNAFSATMRSSVCLP